MIQCFSRIPQLDNYQQSEGLDQVKREGSSKLSWTMQQRLILERIPGSVALVQSHVVFGYGGEIIGQWEPFSSFLKLVSSRGQCWAACWQSQDAAFQENAYKCPINCQELSLLLQVNCNLQDSITQEISCGFTNSTAISHQKCSVWCTFGFCRIKLIERAFLDVQTFLLGNILLQIVMILEERFFVISLGFLSFFWVIESCECCGKMPLITAFCLFYSLSSIVFNEKIRPKTLDNACITPPPPPRFIYE